MRFHDSGARRIPAVQAAGLSTIGHSVAMQYRLAIPVMFLACLLAAILRSSPSVGLLLVISLSAFVAGHLCRRSPEDEKGDDSDGSRLRAGSHSSAAGSPQDPQPPEVGSWDNEEAIFRSFFESNVIVCGIVELNGCDVIHKAINSACAAMFGADRQSMCNRPASEIGLPEEWNDAWLARCEESRRTGVPVHFEHAHQRPEGPRSLLVTIAYLGTAANRRPCFGYGASDVTEQRRLEGQLRQAQKSEAIGALAEGIAHDLDDVIMNIDTCCGLLLSRLGPSDPMRGDLGQIKRAAGSAAFLNSQLLLFLRRSVVPSKVRERDRG
jgi:PAS domain-containing protein